MVPRLGPVTGPMSGYLSNKNELLMLTGAVYAFVAYLTAFTLETLFVVDLAKRSGQALIQISSPHHQHHHQNHNYDYNHQLQASSLPPASLSHAGHLSLAAAAAAASQQAAVSGDELSALEQARRLLESVQSQATVPCLAIAVLFFLTFVASLLLVLALILRSTFFLLTWICIMTTFYLPEFGLSIYVSIYAWGMESRNGQTELIFYLFRSVLNVIFIVRAHRLLRDWSYEKSFFRLKSTSATGSRFSSITGAAGSYGDTSSYFPSGVGESLSTTINPIFSSSTLNLDRYDRVRAASNNSTQYARNWTSTGGNEPTASNSNSKPKGHGLYLLNDRLTQKQQHLQARNNPRGLQPRHFQAAVIGDGELASHHRQTTTTTAGDRSSFDFNDASAAYHLDLDYRTLTQGRDASYHNTNFSHNERDLHHSTTTQRPNAHGNTNNLYLYYHHHHQQPKHSQPSQVTEMSARYSSGHQMRPADQPTNSQFPRPNNSNTASCLSMNNLSCYSTQSLDRRHPRDGGFDVSSNDQVILRPLGHEPFEYLHRPGSLSQLNLSDRPDIPSSVANYPNHRFV